MCHPDGRAQPASQLPSHCPVNRRHHVHHTRDGRQTAESNQYAAARRLHYRRVNWVLIVGFLIVSAAKMAVCSWLIVESPATGCVSLTIT